MNRKMQNLFDEDEKRTRRANYVKSKSKNGELTVHVAADTALKIKRYCKLHSLNCKKFINQILQERMQELETIQYDDLTREELIEILKRVDGEGHVEY